MLLDFQVENYRSYYSPKRFSLIASRQEDLPGHVVDLDRLGLRVLRSAALYGANASGKSNLFKAAWFLGDLLRLGPDALGVEGARRPPFFALVPEAAERPTAFEVNFFLRHDSLPADGVRFEYRLAVRDGQIQEEWLNAHPAGGRTQGWFSRTPAHGPVADIRFSKALKGEHNRLRRVTPPTAPYLWVAEKFGHEQLSIPARWLQVNLANHLAGAKGTTAQRCHEEPAFCKWVSNFLPCADLGIVGVRVERNDGEANDILLRLPAELQPAFRRLVEYEVTFYHAAGPDRQVPLKPADESSGTTRLFELLGPMWQALHQGQVVFIDEMNASMHPLLMHRLIESFNNLRLNRNAAQLILTTHDVSLLRGDLFRRDQIWFTEKNKQGMTDLYSLHDFQPKADVSLEKNYLSGRYGAIPYLAHLDFGMSNGPA